MAQSDSLAQHQQEGTAESETVHAGQMPSVPHAAEGPSCESCARRSNANMSSHAAAQLPVVPANSVTSKW